MTYKKLVGAVKELQTATQRLRNQITSQDEQLVKAYKEIGDLRRTIYNQQSTIVRFDNSLRAFKRSLIERGKS